MVGVAPPPEHRVRRQPPLTFSGGDERLIFEIDGHKKGVPLKINKLSRRLVEALPDRALDLIEIAALVYAVDASISRGESTDQQMGAKWHRLFVIEMPVFDLDIWTTPKIKDALEETLMFLSGDSLQNHTLRAPLAGTILTLDAEMGQLASPTTTLLALADLGSLLVEADVDEAYATQVARGQPVILRLAGESANRDGHVSFVSARVDAATGGLAIKMAFDAPVSAPVGLTVTANIIVEQRDAAPSVPRTALRDTGGGMAVFVVKDGRARLQPVMVVDWPAARLIVTAGLTDGDAVISDATGMVDGQAVAVELP